MDAETDSIKKKSSLLERLGLGLAAGILMEFAFWIFAGLLWLAFTGGIWGLVFAVVFAGCVLFFCGTFKTARIRILRQNIMIDRPFAITNLNSNPSFRALKRATLFYVRTFMAAYRKSLTLLVGLFAVSVIPFYLGHFFNWFDSNLCYSASFSNISSAYSKISSTAPPNWKETFKDFLEGIPNHGYETECRDVEKYTASFLNRLDTISPNPALKQDAPSARPLLVR